MPLVNKLLIELKKDGAYLCSPEAFRKDKIVSTHTGKNGAFLRTAN